MVYNISWDESQPDGSENANTIDTEIQELKESIRERMNDILSNAWETDGDDPKTLNLNPARASLSLTAAETISNASATGVNWDTEDVDQGGLVDLGTQATRITIVEAGFYHLFAFINWDSGSTGIRELRFDKNGIGNVLSQQEVPAQSFGTGQVISWLGPLSAADFIEVIVFQTQGSDLDILTSGTIFSCVKLA